MSNNCDETKCNGDCSSCGGDGVTVTLTLDDDSTVECAIVGIFDGGDKEYIALLPLDENGQNEDGEVYLYRYSKDAAGQPKLENIESDEEYEIASDAFDELLDSMEYDELVSEDELNQSFPDLLCRSEKADAKARFFNLDGSEGMMAGNALRAVAKYLYDNEIYGYS